VVIESRVMILVGSDVNDPAASDRPGGGGAAVVLKLART
jgi:hypothetical protein